MAVMVCLGAFCAPAWAAETDPPDVGITYPEPSMTMNGATFQGPAGTAPGDLPEVTLELFQGEGVTGELVGTQQITAVDGYWYLSWPAFVPDGQYTLRASQSDQASNVGSATATFTLDASGPLPGITAPADGELLTDATPTFAGTLTSAPDDDPGVLVDVFPGDSETEIFSADVLGEDGTWAVTPETELPDGEYTLQVVQYDASGDFDTRAVTFRVDSTAPEVTIATPEGDTNRIRPYLSGTGSAGIGDVQSVTVELFSGAVAEGTPMFTGEPGVSAGLWATSPPDLAEGVYTLRATQVDVAGNASTAVRTFRVDWTDPVLTIGPAPAATDRRPSFSGTAGTAEGDAGTVHAALTGSGGFEVDVPVVDGRWSVTTPADLAAGIYTFTVTQHDSAGNRTQLRHSRFRIAAPGFVPTGPVADRLGPQITLPSTVRLRKPYATVKLTISEPGNAAVSLRIGRTTVKRRAADVFLKQPMTLRLRLTKKQQQRVIRQRRKLTLHVAARDVFGNQRSVAGKVKLKR